MIDAITFTLVLLTMPLVLYVIARTRASRMKSLSSGRGSSKTTQSTVQQLAPSSHGQLEWAYQLVEQGLQEGGTDA